MEQGKRGKLIPRDISESLGKLPPAAVELEETVLGAAILERNALIEIVDKLKPEDFYRDAHKCIWSAVLDLYNTGMGTDMRSVVAQLRKRGEIELIGGMHVIAELTSQVSSGESIEQHALMVLEMSMKRRLILMASDIHHKAYDDKEDVFSLIDDSQKQLDGISSNQLNVIHKAGNVLDAAIKRIGELRNETGITGVPSGWPTLDRITGGWQVGLIVIAARPGMGKTAWAVGVVLNAAIRHKIPVLIFSLEMSKEQIMFRMIAHESEVELDRIIKGKTSDDELVKISHLTQKIKDADIYIDDTVALHILELRAKVRRAITKFKTGLIVIDYLQLMRGNQKGNREQEISSISSALKNLSKEVNRPIIALSQLSRDLEKRGGDKRPQLSDLRESGSIEQDANVVGFLYRPEYYKIKDYDNGESTKGVIEVIFAKHRDGPAGTARLEFNEKFVRVQERGPKTKEEQTKLQYRQIYDTTTTNEDSLVPF